MGVVAYYPDWLPDMLNSRPAGGVPRLFKPSFVNGVVLITKATILNLDTAIMKSVTLLCDLYTGL